MLRRVVDLFQLLQHPPTTNIIGLIAELLVIANSRAVETAAGAWRSGISDHFDFSLDEGRVDVKATGNRARVHHFSFEQCNPPPGTVGIVVSIFVEAAGGGPALRDIVDRIDQRLGANVSLQMKVREQLAATLGSSLGDALGYRFDEKLAASSTRYYDLRVVPAIREVPGGVSAVQFRSDLIGTDNLSVSDLEAGGKVTWLLPR
jgi:hypothetical protein